jgi:hypothetical protein
VIADFSIQVWIGVEKSASHHQSQNDIGDANTRFSPGSQEPKRHPAVAAVTTSPAAAPPATLQGSSALAERLSRLREQAEQLARELDALEKESRKK